MTSEFALDLVRQATMVAIFVGGPLLALSLIAGLLVGVFQAVTQINEYTLTFLPKVVALVAMLLVMGPWLLGKLVEFTAGSLGRLPEMVR